MHNCEEFRERITEHIIDREDLTADPRFRSDLLICSDCCEFYLDSREMMNALVAVDASVRDLDVSPFRFSRQKWGSLPVSAAVDAAAGLSPRLRTCPEVGVSVSGSASDHSGADPNSSALSESPRTRHDRRPTFSTGSR